MSPRNSASSLGGQDRLVMAIDQGTTGSTVALFRPVPTKESHELLLVAQANQEYRQIYPQPGWVEHDGHDIWQSVLDAMGRALGAAEAQGYANPAHAIVAIGITNQRETVLCFDRETGTPLAHAIVWQDRRTAKHCEALRARRELAQKIRFTTGLVLDPYFSATKIAWLLQNNSTVASAIASQRAVFGTVDSYLCHRLTGGASFVTEPSNASRTLLVDLETADYSPELLKTFGIPRAALPDIRDSIGSFGTTKNVAGLPDGIPVTGILGDQQAALFGQRAFAAGQAKITFGTGSFVLMHTGNHPVRPSEASGLLTTIANRIGGKTAYALEGSCFIAGAAIQFLRDQLGFFESASACEALALRDPADETVQFVPSLAGLSAPFWNPHARGVLFGLTRGTTRSQITRAVLESIAFQNVPLLQAMQEASGHPLAWIGIDGGASANTTLMQFQADLLQTELRRPSCPEATAMGAALAAWAHLEPAALSNPDSQETRRFLPTMSKEEADRKSGHWLKAVHAVDAYYTN